MKYKNAEDPTRACFMSAMLAASKCIYTKAMRAKVLRGPRWPWVVMRDLRAFQKLAVLAVLMVLSGQSIRAEDVVPVPSKGPYFRIIGSPGYVRQILEEACFQPAAGLSETSSCTSVPLVTHSQRDGHILFPGEDWTVLTAGWAIRPGGSPIIMLGMGANLSPIVKGAALSTLKALTKDDSFVNLKGMLAPPSSSVGPDVTINAGVKWGLDVTGRARGVFMLSVGPAFSF